MTNQPGPGGPKGQPTPAPTTKHQYTTGPLVLPENAPFLGIHVLNNSASQQTIHVFVYQLNSPAAKTVVHTNIMVLSPNDSNRDLLNFQPGFFGEVQIRCDSRRIFPHVYFADPNATPIQGGNIHAASFIRRLV